jgi:hypothetical protein
VIGAVLVLAAAGVALSLANPFASAGAANAVVADNASATGLYTVTRQNLSAQIPVPGTLGYAGTFTIGLPSGASASQVEQAQQAVTQDQQTLSADEQTESDTTTADNQAVASDQATVSTDQSTLASDQAAESTACAGTGASTTCSQDQSKVSMDQIALNQAEQQLAASQSTATLDHDHDQAAVASDQTKLQGDQATLASLQATAVNSGTTYTWLPQPGEVIKEDQPVYSLSNEPVPLLYGSIPAYRAFYPGMSDGADIGELTKDLIALGYGDGLAQSNHYSAATAAAVGRWQEALGLPATGGILLGQVIFEPGPIQVNSVTPAVGQSVSGSGAAGVGGGGGGGGGAGGTVLTATSTTPQVSIALDAGEQSDVADGDKVTITLPDNENTPGVISWVGAVATLPASNGSNSSGSSSSASSGTSGPTITVVVNLADPAAARGWDQAPVNVTITTASVSSALVVPVAALLAKPGGGYAVEVAGAAGARRLVAVSLGLFDDNAGLVQVTGTSLAAGQKIVVPNL